MTTSNNGSAGAPANEGSSSNEEFLLGFKRVEQEVRAAPETSLAPVNLDVPSTVTTVLGAWPEISALREQVAGLKGFDVTQLDKLRDYALALGHAHGVYRGASGPPDGVAKLGEELSSIRDMLFADAIALAKRGVFDEGRIVKLRSGSSYKNLAFDVVGLVEVLRERWADIAGRTGVQSAELDHAAQLAQRLVTAVGVREQQPVATGAASLLRQQAFTLLLAAYDEVQRAISFLRWHEDDVESIAPSLWAGRGSRPAPQAPAAAPTSSIDTLPGVGTVTGSGAAPAVTSPATGVGVGLPGSAPLLRN
jgi:hypothetical protein